jgi:anti-sigma-K factor RskA
MNDHPELLNGAYVLDALDEVERAAVERHLRTCETCAVEVAEFAEAAARLGAAEAVAPPPELRNRVLAAARNTRQLPPRLPQRPSRPGRARLGVAVAAAVAVLAGTVGTTWWVQQNRIDDQRARVVAAQQENVRVRAVLAAPDARLRVSSDAPTGRFTAIYSASQGAAVLTFGGLGDVPAGKTYQLWRVAGGVAQNLGALPPGTRGGSLVVENVRTADQLAVSVENEGGVAAPTRPYATVAMS